jgi:hypothetical protein
VVLMHGLRHSIVGAVKSIKKEASHYLWVVTPFLIWYAYGRFEV